MKLATELGTANLSGSFFQLLETCVGHSSGRLQSYRIPALLATGGTRSPMGNPAPLRRGRSAGESGEHDDRAFEARGGLAKDVMPRELNDATAPVWRPKSAGHTSE